MRLSSPMSVENMIEMLEKVPMHFKVSDQDGMNIIGLTVEFTYVQLIGDEPACAENDYAQPLNVSGLIEKLLLCPRQLPVYVFVFELDSRFDEDRDVWVEGIALLDDGVQLLYN